MKYTDEQKRILALCRKYSKVHCSFDTMDGRPVARLYIKPNWDRDDFVPYSEVEEWLKKHSKLKSVGRPKGSTKPSSKVKRDISLSADKWSKVERIQREQGLKYASHAIGHCIDFFADYCLNEEVSNE